MKRKTRIGLVVAAMGVIAVAGVLLWPDNEPRYQGKTVSYWFKQYYLVGEGNETAYTQQQLDEVLHKLGTNALPYLVKQALSTAKDTAFRTNVYEWLGKLPASWHPPPFVSYDDIRQEAVDAIEEINPSAAVILPHVRKALDGEDGLQRLQALRVIDVVSEGSRELLPWFLGALRSTNIECVAIGVHNMEVFGPDARDAVPDLIAILKDKQSEKYQALHEGVVDALGEIGPDAAAAVPVLKDEFNSQKNWQERSETAVALCKIDAQQSEAINYLIDELKFPQPEIYSVLPEYGALRAGEAAGFLGQIGPHARPAIPALIDALDSTNAIVMVAAVGALSQIGAARQSYLPKLEDKLKMGDEAERLQVARIILHNVDQTNRMAVSIVADAIKGGSTNQVNALYATRGGLSPPPKEIVEAMREALNSPVPAVRMLAEEELKRIEGN